MKRKERTLTRISAHRLLAAWATAMAVLSGCGSGTAPESDAAPSVSVSVTPPAASPAAAPSFDVIGGEVRGPAELPFAAGEEVVFEVSSDTADEVHVHGYDVLVPVAPEQPATVRFTADIPGVFEVELENAGRRLTNLRVR